MPRAKPQTTTALPAIYGYARVSTDEQAATGQSLAAQQHKLESWARFQHEREIAQTFVEQGVSGGVPFRERPQGAALFAQLKPGDIVVAAKLDRMFRSAADCLQLVEEFQRRRVHLYLLDLNGGADDVSGNGIARLFLTIVSAFAEFERDRIGERIRETKRRQTARRQYSGGIVRWGWRVTEGRRLEPDPAKAHFLALARKLRAEGHTLRAIQAELAQRGERVSLLAIDRAVKAPVL